MAPTPGRHLAGAVQTAVAPFAPAPAEVDAVIDDLRRRHREPHRRYHTLEHLDEVLLAVDRLVDEAEHPGRVRLAACYHDAVYDPRSDANEDDSAALAFAALRRLGVPASDADAVARLVRSTADHEPGDDRDAVVLSDADLWILGSPPERYRRYVTDVRTEYAHVDDDAWRAGRSAVLDRFLARSRLYATDRFHAELDELARANMAAERAALD